MLLLLLLLLLLVAVMLLPRLLVLTALLAVLVLLLLLLLTASLQPQRNPTGTAPLPVAPSLPELPRTLITPSPGITSRNHSLGTLTTSTCL
jgi:hypothetical protein